MAEPAAAPTPAGLIRPGQWLLDAALGGWLAFAGTIFRGGEGPVTWRFALAAAALATLAGAGETGLGSHRPALRRVARLGLWLGLMAALRLAASAVGVAASWGFSAWLATAILLAGLFTRRLLVGLGLRTNREILAEALRLSLLLAAGVYALLPVYTARGVGSGDADWYAIMLADYVEQIRLGAFPVWLGQTEYAFNGAFSPLRLAPWFQHAGGLLDQVTFRSLDYMALKNAVVALHGLLLAGSAYGFLRAILRPSPSTACGLAILLLFSPAMLAPLYVGDQYMTFVALPFLPAVCYGLWRAYERNDLTAHGVLAAGLAGLWLAHTPVALWTSVLATVAYVGKILAHRGRGELSRLALGAALFLPLGTWPVLSALSLDNTAKLTLDADTVSGEVAKAFPKNLGRLSASLSEPADYQPGWTLLGLLAVAVLLLPWRRSPIAAALAVCITLCALFTLPVPGVTEFLWRQTPSLVIQVTNSWPMQRLMPVAGCLIVFLFAAVFPPGGVGPRRWLGPALLLVALPPFLWSRAELAHLHTRAYQTVSQMGADYTFMQRHNVLLTRYAYSSFAYAPATFSHGYMNPALEHRLLRLDLTPLASNLESAARKGALPAPDPDGSALLAHGTFTAVNDNHSTFYNLSPQLTLPAGTPLALWLEPLAPGESGWFQLIAPGLFREYLLPDSGMGILRQRPTVSFGTQPTSTPIMPVYTPRALPEPPRLIVISPQRKIEPRFDFARFELWRYQPDQLPVNVQSWVPYRMRVHSPEAAYVETPRMWLRGYRATINGQVVEAERSPDNLVMFRIPAGESNLVVRYSPPPLLRTVYWICLAGWCLLGLTGLRRLTRPTLTA